MDSTEAVPLTAEEEAELRADPMMVHTFDAYRIVATLAAARIADPGGLREARLADLATRLLFVRWGAVVYPVELAGPDGIVVEPTRDEWRAALAPPPTAPAVGRVVCGRPEPHEPHERVGALSGRQWCEGRDDG